MSADQKKSGGSWLTGCGIVLLVLLVLGGVGGYFAYQSFRAMMGETLQAAGTQMVEDSALAEEQQAAVIAEIDRAAEAFAEGSLGFADLDGLYNGIEQRGVFDYVALLNLHDREFKPLLDEAAEAEALQQIHRIGRGLVDRVVSAGNIDDALAPYFDARPLDAQSDFDPENPQQADRRWEPRDTLDEQGLEQVVEALRTLADERTIDADVAPPDVAGQIREVIDRYLN